MFEVGDVVVCVDVSTPNRDGILPTTIQLGHVDRVTSVYMGKVGDLGVSLAKAKPRVGQRGFKAFRFRKLPKADASFTEQMRALRPHKAPVTANESLSLMIIDLVEAM